MVGVYARNFTESHPNPNPGKTQSIQSDQLDKKQKQKPEG